MGFLLFKGDCYLIEKDFFFLEGAKTIFLRLQAWPTFVVFKGPDKSTRCYNIEDFKSCIKKNCNGRIG